MIRIALLVVFLFSLALSGACRPASDSGEDAKAQVPVHSEVLERTPFRTSRVLLGRVEPAARTPVLAPLSGRISFPARFAGGRPGLLPSCRRNTSRFPTTSAPTGSRRRGSPYPSRPRRPSWRGPP